jgi:hypothetical protein
MDHVCKCMGKCSKDALNDWQARARPTLFRLQKRGRLNHVKMFETMRLVVLLSEGNQVAFHPAAYGKSHHQKGCGWAAFVAGPDPATG